MKSDMGLANRWGLRGKRGKSIQVGLWVLSQKRDCCDFWGRGGGWIGGRGKLLEY